MLIRGVHSVLPSLPRSADVIYEQPQHHDCHIDRDYDCYQRDIPKHSVPFLSALWLELFVSIFKSRRRL